MIARRWLSGVMFLSLLLSLPFLSFFAASARADEAAKPADVRIIIDISGSMKESDPQNLRVPALNLLTELLPDDARSGVWTFGRLVNMLVPLGQVDDAWRTQAKQQAKAINSVGLHTNLTGALEKALWKVSADSGYEHSVILLTDGKIDMSGTGGAGDINQRERQRLMQDILPRYLKAGAKIHTVALSEAADSQVLQQLALDSNGLFLRAENADDLLKAFLKAFDKAVPVEQVPMENNRFDIDASVEEFTALIFRRAGADETRLIAPSGEVITEASSRRDANVRWHHDVNFDLVTVKAPQAGGWQADADLDPDNRVQILSDLKLAVNGLPNSIFAGYPVDLEIALINEDKVVNEPALLQLTDVSLKVMAPDGRAGSKLLSDPEALPKDGVFRESLTRLSQQGEYQIEITAVGRTFQRRQILTTTLMEPLAVEIEPDYNAQVLNVRVLPQVDNIDISLSRIIARIESPDQSSVIQSMDFDEDKQWWHLPLQADKGPGVYQAVLNIRGVTSNGNTFKSKPEEIQVEFPLVDPQAKVAAPLESSEPGMSDASAEQLSNAAPAEAAAMAAPEPVVNEPVPAPESEPAPQLDSQSESQPEQAQPDIVPDLAEKARQQQAQEAMPEPAVDVEDMAADDGLAWWVYVLIALVNLAIFGAAGWWWWNKRNQENTLLDDGPEMASSQLPPDLEPAEFDIEDLDGDFDSFDDDSEEEILPSATAAVVDSSDAAADAMPNASAMSDTELDDDFALDGAVDAPEEDWGEFDDLMNDDSLGASLDDAAGSSSDGKPD